MQALDWKTPDGCATCRPALNYYLLCDLARRIRATTRQSRFINERVHANIQKDGTYSVVPRMWGGVTTPAELRAIADVVDKFKIPTVKVTGGQRIDLLGVQEGGPARGLGRPQRCRHGLRPRLRQGAAHGEDLRRLGMVPLRHAGFDRPRHQAREVHVGLVDAAQGQAGGLRLSAQLRRGDLQGRRRDLRRLRLRDPLRRRRRASTSRAPSSSARSTTEDEVLEVIAALTQLYREQGRYLERIVQMGEARRPRRRSRRQVVDDADKRTALLRPLRLLAAASPRSIPGRSAPRGKVDARVRAAGRARLRSGGVTA